MDNKSLKNEEQSHHSEEEQQQLHKAMQTRRASQVSEFIKDYQKEFDSVASLWSLAQIQNKLLKTGRICKRENFMMEITETILSTDFQSISLELQYGFYAIKINVINVLFDSLFLDEIAIGEGQFGTVYQCCYKEADLAIKVANLSGGQESLVGAIKKIYKEYFIAVIANQLQIGPKIIDIFGYNLVFMKNKAFFCMEKCQQSSAALVRQGAIKINNLKTDLHMLHRLRLVHRDIKPTNVCWSPNFKKYVLIDFGLSTIIKQTQGQKSYTKFVGTYAFCSKEMQKLFMLKESGYVDFYYNDTHGLKKTLEHFQLTNTINNLQLEFDSENLKLIKHNGKMEESSVLMDFIRITSLKLKFFTNQFETIMQEIENQPKLHKSCLEMMAKCIQSGLVPKKILQKWRNLILKTKQKIKSQDCKSSKSDQLIYRYLKMLNSKNLINQLIPLEYVFENQINNFEDVLNDKQWIQRIFTIINPNLVYYLNNKNKNNKIQETATYVINKIYKTVNKTDTGLMIKKVRFVLLFLVKKSIEQKNVNILEPLSDILVILGDHVSSRRIKLSLLEILDGSIMFYLQSLKFYLQAQPTRYFSLPTSQTQYLDNIINSISNNKNRNQMSNQLHQIQLIGKQFALLLSEQPDAKNALQIYTKINNQIENLKQKIGCSDLGSIANEIKELFCQMYIRLLENLIIFHNKTSIEFGVQQILENQKEKRHQRLKDNNKISTLEFNCLYQNISSYFQRYSDLKLQPNDLNEMIELYFQIIEGRADLLDPLVWQIILNNIVQNANLVTIILQLKLKWLQKRSMDENSVYNILVLELKSVLELAIEIHLNFSNSNLNEEQRIDCCPYIQKMLFCIRKHIECNIKDKIHLFLLNRFISIIEALKVFSKREDSDSMQTIQNLFELATNNSVENKNLMEDTISLISMVNVFARVRRQKLLISHKATILLEKYMIKLWEFTDFIIGGLTSKYILSQIVHVYNKNQRYEKNFLLFLNIFDIMATKSNVYNSKSLMYLREGFYQFVDSSSPEVQSIFLKSFLTNYFIDEGVDNLSKQAIFFLFLMVLKSYNHTEFALVRKSFIIIANRMQQLEPCIQKTIKSKIYGIYLKKSKFCYRKGLILQRIESRQNCQRQEKKYVKLTRTLRQKVAKIYKNSIRSRLESKLNQLIF